MERRDFDIYSDETSLVLEGKLSERVRGCKGGGGKKVQHGEKLEE